MRRLAWLFALAVACGAIFPGTAAAAEGPSGSTECHVADDDCDGSVDEDPVDGVDNDGDGQVDEDPSGDTSDNPDKNQVDCNEENSQDVAGVAHLYAGDNGAKACADDSSALPIDGRATVDTDEGYVAIDGDNSNPEPANGYARVDSNGVHCGSDDNQDSTADQSNNGPEDCG